MANRLFAITVARETVILDDQGSAQVSFTVSNTGPKALAGRAKLVALGSTKESWLGLEGEAERNFAKGESHQFTVKIAAPPGTPVGKHVFRLNIISVENPDDDFTEGPSVSFEVRQLAPAAPPQRKFPWWIVAVAGVLVLGAGIITWLLLPGGIAVPGVVGMPYGDAVTTLAKLQLAAEEAGQRITGEFPPGVVVAQDPGKDTKVPKGKKVTLIVEAKSVLVPDVKGLTVVQAFAKLVSLQLKPKYKDVVDSEWPRVYRQVLADPVDWQSPEAGTRVAPDTIVTVDAPRGTGIQSNPLYRAP